MATAQTLPSTEKQSQVFGRYLVRAPLPQDLTRLYDTAVASGALGAPSNASRLLTYGIDHPALLPYLDAYAALLRPASDLRQRLYLIFSIIEASPYFADSFLPRQRSPLYIFVIPLIGLRALWRLLIGIFIVKLRRL